MSENSRPVKRSRPNLVNSPCNLNDESNPNDESKPSTANRPNMSSGLQNSESGGVQSAIPSRRLDENNNISTEIFNRTNVTFEVVPRKSGKSEMEKLANDIKSRLGAIVLFCWRNETQKIAESLTSFGVSARPYLVNKLKTREDWMAGHFQVICTSPTEYDIDRKDVRFALHYRPPKSIEEFCRQAGVVGKDGAPATCTLFSLNINDINFSASICCPEEKEKLYQLNQLVYYTRNNLECRKLQLARWLGEEKDEQASACHTGDQKCDNCANSVPFQIQNFRNQAEAILKFVRQKNLTESPDFTITQFIEGLLKGSKCKKFTDEEHVQLRALVAQLWRFEKADLDRLLRKMICDDLLSEDLHRIQNDEKDYLMSYLRLGAQANSLFSDAAFQFNFPVETRCVPPIAEEDSKSTEDYQKLLEKFGELEGAYKRLQEEHQKLQEEHRKLQEEHQRTRRAALDDEDLIKFDPIDSEPVQATHPIKLERVQPATPPATSTNDGGSGRKRKRDETAEH